MDFDRGIFSKNWVIQTVINTFHRFFHNPKADSLNLFHQFHKVFHRKKKSFSPGNVESCHFFGIPAIQFIPFVILLPIGGTGPHRKKVPSNFSFALDTPPAKCYN